MPLVVNYSLGRRLGSSRRDRSNAQLRVLLGAIIATHDPAPVTIQTYWRQCDALPF